MKFIVFMILLFGKSSHQQQQRKNIVVIMADDLGFNDVSFRGSNEIPTPNIDALAFNGAILNRFYTPPLCTPSRASIMTGKYPFRTGMQHYVIPSDEPWALGKEEKILPQYLKDAGYSTALIGKWHLGFYQEQYTPTRRGFDYHFGYVGPYIDYFDYTLKDFKQNYSRGYDMRENLTVAGSIDRIYATNLFTSKAVDVIEKQDKTKPLFLMVNHLAPHAGNEDVPMQAPQEEIAKFNYIANEKRRTLAAMVSVLDQSVGKIVQSLKDRNMLKETVIVFYSDNGGPTIGLHSTNASNYPLRGQKNSGWEGAMRTNAIVYSGSLRNPGVVRNQLMHVSDLFPTILGIAGVNLNLNRLRLDGVDQWNVINYGGGSARAEMINIDDVFGFGALIASSYKLVNGSTANGDYDGWLASKSNDGDNDSFDYAVKVLTSRAGKSIYTTQTRNHLNLDKILQLRGEAAIKCTNNVEKAPCNLKKGPCLFDIYEDPCEENNIASKRPVLLRLMLMRYMTIKNSVVQTRRKPADPACDPINFNQTWQWWQKDS